jgi:hypothetical protein
VIQWNWFWLDRIANKRATLVLKNVVGLIGHPVVAKRQVRGDVAGGISLSLMLHLPLVSDSPSSHVDITLDPASSTSLSKEKRRRKGQEFGANRPH